MFDTFVDKAWACFDKLTSDRNNPPDKRNKSKESKPTINWMCSPDDRIEAASSSGSEFGRSMVMALDPAKIPEPKQLEMAFAQLLEELDLPASKQKQLSEQSAEKKWIMIVEQSNRGDKLYNKQSCSSIVSKLVEFSRHFPEKFEWPLLAQTLDFLSISLRTESFSFVQEFLDLEGIELLVALLNEARRYEAAKVALPILTSFRALLNSPSARDLVLENKEVLFAITVALDIPYFRTKIVTLEILSGLCLMPEGGHRAVLEALTEAKKSLGERTRFQRIVDDLHREYGTSSRDSERVRIALMSFINALLRSGPAEHSLEFRQHLRYELLMLGIQEAIDCLRNTHGVALENHFDLFEMMRQEDEQEMASSVDSGASSPTEMDSPIALAEALNKRLDKTTALPHLVSLLQHLLMIPGNEKYAPLWKYFDVILQQLSLQTSMGPMANESDPQFVVQPLKFDMDEVLSRLRTQQEYDRLEKEHVQIQSELDNERKRVLELENRIADMQDGSSLSSYCRNSETSSNPSDPCQTPPLVPSVSGIPQIKPPPPPPAPPPSALQLGKGGKLVTNQEKKKNVPSPCQPLKMLNWKKVPTNKIPGTLWEKMDDEKLYKSIDLVAFGQCFSSTKEHDHGTMSSATLRRFKEPTTITVLEARRAQNCTIMLSKLKLNHREIRMAVLSMDEKGKIPKDMIEQMLKFVPTTDELMQLTEVIEKHGTASVLALGDRFFYEIGKIPRYEQRLRCLNIIRSFQEKLDEFGVYVNSVSKASSTVQSSKKLKQLFGLILALGNYLNHSKHNGNAEGFTIDSLRVIPDVKNSVKPETNLLHFIVELLEQKFPDLMKLKKDLSPVYEAAKYNKGEMEAELRAIEAMLKEVTHELTTQQKMPKTSASESCIADPVTPESARASKSESDALKKSDRFVDVVGAFVATAKKQFAEIEKVNTDMYKKFIDCVSYFAEDASTASPDQFFGVFSRFLNQFAECQHYLLEHREEEERIKRQTIAKSFIKRGRRRGGGGGDGRDFERLIDAIQSGDIFSEDLTRLRTSFRMPMRKK